MRWDILLNKSKIKKEYNITIPYWKDSLYTFFVREMKDSKHKIQYTRTINAEA